MSGARRSTFLLACENVPTEDWATELRRNLDPAIDLRIWPEIAEAADVHYAMGWGNPPGFWTKFKELKALFSLGAGVETMIADTSIPTSIPLIRMIDPSLETEMADFILSRVIHHHRLLHRYERQQTEHDWAPLRPPLARDRTVGIMGLGRLGVRCAQDIARRGFDTRGWSRTPHSLADLKTYYGAEGLDAFAGGCDILICLLPLTSETEGLLDLTLLSKLNPGACVINVGRGAHLIEEDLISALNNGQVEAATLDVARQEPLPSDHPFWSHPGVRLFPHIAAFTHPQSAALVVGESLRRLIAGETVDGLVERTRGY